MKNRLRARRLGRDVIGISAIYPVVVWNGLGIADVDYTDKQQQDSSLKAGLRTAGVEVPHVHDVGFLLAEQADRLPADFATHVERVVSISRRLRQEREVSFYGDDEIDAPPERLYSPDDAEQPLGDARSSSTWPAPSFADRGG